MKNVLRTILVSIKSLFLIERMEFLLKINILYSQIWSFMVYAIRAQTHWSPYYREPNHFTTYPSYPIPPYGRMQSRTTAVPGVTTRGTQTTTVATTPSTMTTTTSRPYVSQQRLVTGKTVMNPQSVFLGK